MAISIPYGFGLEVLDALGIKDTEVTRVLIDLNISDECVKIYVTRLMTTNQEQPLLSALQQVANHATVEEVEDVDIDAFGAVTVKRGVGHV